MFGAIEAGGTKFVCGVGTGPGDLATESIPTTTPDATLARVIDFFRARGPIDAVGIGSFGPIDRERGRITTTPKSAWRNCDIVGPIDSALRVPVAFDTDVNAAALGEARWGAGQGLSDFVYVTVGTGIGGGAVANGEVVHGRMHPEMGHVRIRHDLAQDSYPGCCPYHGDCLEGLASGPALQARWGRPPELLPADHPGWRLEARYLADGLVSLVYTLSPQRFLLGGGVMQHSGLLDLVREELGRLLNGYGDAGDVATPALGARSGVLGALALAEQAHISFSRK